MRYSYIFASLAASAVATPLTNLKITESQDTHHHGLSDRALRWFSALWGGNDHQNEEGQVGNPIVARTTNAMQPFPANRMTDRLVGSGYECVVQSNRERDERRSTRECCREIGGELSGGMALLLLYDHTDNAAVQERCIFRNVRENPREYWRSCAMRQRGVTFADCYHRGTREVGGSHSGGVFKRGLATLTGRLQKGRHHHGHHTVSRDDDVQESCKRHRHDGKHHHSRHHRHGHSHSRSQHKGGHRALLQHVLLDVADSEIGGESDERFVCQVEGSGEEEQMHTCCVLNGGKEGQDSSTSRPTVSLNS
jgi:hypothetical protein